MPVHAVAISTGFSILAHKRMSRNRSSAWLAANQYLVGNHNVQPVTGHTMDKDVQSNASYKVTARRGYFADDCDR